DILSRMPVPGNGIGGPMHRVPALQWKTWVRLAFVEAGSDWRSLNKLRVVDGKLADYLIVPAGRNHGLLGVQKWDEPSGPITSRSIPSNGNFAVAAPRGIKDNAHYNVMHVTPWDANTKTITSSMPPAGGAMSIADPRPPHNAPDSYNQYGVNEWDQPVGTI